MFSHRWVHTFRGGAGDCMPHLPHEVSAPQSGSGTTTAGSTEEEKLVTVPTGSVHSDCRDRQRE